MRQLHEEWNNDDDVCKDGEEPLFDDPPPRKKGRDQEDEEFPVDEDREAMLATLRDVASTSTLPPTTGDEKSRPQLSSPVTALEWKALGNKHWLAGDLKCAAEAYHNGLAALPPPPPSPEDEVAGEASGTGISVDEVNAGC
eukprot:COSAG05_NODE_103_length_19033_cov_99.004278_15_plen_141_part_00